MMKPITDDSNDPLSLEPHQQSGGILEVAQDQSVEEIWQVKSVSETDDSLLEQAAEFLQSFLPADSGPVWSSDHFKWKLGGSNPSGSGFMTVAIHNGAVIGVTTVTRKRLWDGEKEVAGAEIGDTYSHPEFRRKGHAEIPYGAEDYPGGYLNRSIFGRLVTETRERAEKSGISLIFGTPNENSMPGYINRLGFFHYNSHQNQVFIRPSSAGLVLRLPVLKPIKWIFNYLEQGLAKALKWTASGFGRLEAHEATKIGAEFDELWQRLSQHHTLGPLRDRAYFNHRFNENPMAKYRVWTVKQKGSICGVFVTCSKTDKQGLQTHYLADWMLDHYVKGIFRFVVADFIAKLGGSSTKSFLFWGEREWTRSQRVLSLGCMGGSSVPIIFFDHADSRRLQDTNPILDFTLATSDNI